MIYFAMDLCYLEEAQRKRKIDCVWVGKMSGGGRPVDEIKATKAVRRPPTLSPLREETGAGFGRSAGV